MEYCLWNVSVTIVDKSYRYRIFKQSTNIPIVRSLPICRGFAGTIQLVETISS